MGADLDDEVPVVSTELYDADFDAFVAVRPRARASPRPHRFFPPRVARVPLVSTHASARRPPARD